MRHSIQNNLIGTIKHSDPGKSVGGEGGGSV